MSSAEPHHHQLIDMGKNPETLFSISRFIWHVLWNIQISRAYLFISVPVFVQGIVQEEIK